MDSMSFNELSSDELQDIDGGGWLTVVGGVLIVAGAIVSGGTVPVVIGGIAGGVLTAVSGL